MANGYYGVETLYQTFLNSAFFFSTCEYVLSKGTGNSDGQNGIRDSRKYQYWGNWGKKVVLYLLAKIYNGHNVYVYILLEMNW